MRVEGDPDLWKFMNAQFLQGFEFEIWEIGLGTGADFEGSFMGRFQVLGLRVEG